MTVCAANWYSRVVPVRHLESVTKPLATILVIWVAIAAHGPKTATAIAVVGLVFCLIGDVALMPIIDRFIVGLGAFLLGHGVFIAMFVALHLRRPWWGAIAFAILSVHALMFARPIIGGAAAGHPELRLPVVAYFVVIMSMAVVAAMTGRWWAIAGAAAFVISDTILGWGHFVREQRAFPLAIMMTYHAALVGLALSLR